MKSILPILIALFAAIEARAAALPGLPKVLAAALASNTSGCSCGCTGSCGADSCACSPAPADGTTTADTSAAPLQAANTFTVANFGASAYTINGTNNPTLTLTRGVTYTFNITASGHPFDIKTIQGNTNANRFTNGVTGNGTQIGALTFTVPLDAPATLFYDCEIHPSMTGVINIVPEPTVLWLAGMAGGGMLLRRRRR